MSKGLKEPSDKLQLIKVLSLSEVVDALETKTRAEQTSRKASGETDEGEESYREALGRLLNALGLELMKLIDVRCSSQGPANSSDRVIWRIDRTVKTRQSAQKRRDYATKSYRSCCDS